MLKYKTLLTFGLKQDTNRSLQYFSPVFHVWNINGYIGSHNTDRGLEIALDFNPQRSTTELLSPVVKLLFFPGKARNTHCYSTDTKWYYDVDKYTEVWVIKEDSINLDVSCVTGNMTGMQKISFWIT